MSIDNAAAAVPVHLGIIPDGNRRWAKSKGLPSLEGHRKGVQVAREIAMAAFDRGVKYFTMYAFSTENWKRTKDEVGYLMELFCVLVKNEFRELDQRNARFKVIGSRTGLSRKLLDIIDETEARTANNTAGTLSLCLNYGGQVELADAVKAILAAGVQPEEVTPSLISQYLYAPDVPPVDLVVRTSGEQRLSGFMMWRTDYAEFEFLDKHWPEFTVSDLDKVLADYAGRHRRFGS